MAETESWMDRVTGTMGDIAHYSANLVVNSARSMTIGHEYTIEESDLSPQISQEMREALALYGNEILAFYKETPEATDAGLRRSINNISDTTSVVGMYTGGGVAFFAGASLTAGATVAAGPLTGAAAGVATVSVLIPGGAMAGECAAAAVGSATEVVINMGFESPRKLTRDMLVADINAAVGAQIPAELILQELDKELASRQNSFSNGSIITDVSFSQSSLIHNAFINAGEKIPTHENTWLDGFREQSKGSDHYKAIPTSFSESFDAFERKIPCDFEL